MFNVGLFLFLLIFLFFMGLFLVSIDMLGGKISKCKNLRPSQPWSEKEPG